MSETPLIVILSEAKKVSLSNFISNYLSYICQTIYFPFLLKIYVLDFLDRLLLSQ